MGAAAVGPCPRIMKFLYDIVSPEDVDLDFISLLFMAILQIQRLDAFQWGRAKWEKHTNQSHQKIFGRA